MKRLLRIFLGASSERHPEPKPLRYQRHPQVITLGEALFLEEGPAEDMVLNEVGTHVWKQLEVPRTQEELVSAVMHHYSVDARTATRDIRAFLEALSTKGL